MVWVVGGGGFGRKWWVGALLVRTLVGIVVGLLKAIQRYFYMKSGLDTIQRPYK